MTKGKRLSIYNKCNGHCAYCGVKLEINKFTVDHLVPKCNMGKNNIDNLLPCCTQCNKKKGNLSLDLFRLKTFWTVLTIADLKSLTLAIRAAKKHLFYFEIH